MRRAAVSLSVPVALVLVGLFLSEYYAGPQSPVIRVLGLVISLIGFLTLFALGMMVLFAGRAEARRRS